MKKSRFSEEKIISILKMADSGKKVADICREYGIAPPTYYKWKAKFGGMEVSEAKRLKALEDENRRLKQIIADQALDIQGLKFIVQKKW